MVFPKRTLANGDCAHVQRFGVVGSPLLRPRCTETDETERDVLMVRAERLLEDRQRSLVEHLRSAVTAERQIHIAKIVEALRNLWIVRAARALCDRDGTFIERLCLRVVPLKDMDVSKVVERGRDVRGIGTERVLEDRE